MKQLGYFLLIFVLLGCASANKAHVIETKDTKALDDLISGKYFEIVSDWAQPQLTSAMAQVGNAGLLPPGSNVGNINLIGNPNFLKMKGNEVEAYLPYYGERQMGGTYNNNRTGIEFEGIPQDFEVNRGKKDSYEIIFTVSDKNTITETYRVVIQLFPNLSSAITINSSQRFPIRYKGHAKTTEKENEM